MHIVNYYHLFANVCNFSMRLIADHLTLFAFTLHASLLIRFVAQYGEINARSQSILCQNVFSCAQRYHRCVGDVIYNSVNSYINAFAYNFVDYTTHSAAYLPTELLMLRDRVFCFSNGFLLSHDELNHISL